MRNKMLALAGLASIFALGAHAQQQIQTPINQPNPRMTGQGKGSWHYARKSRCCQTNPPFGPT
jgi:hypothetical protein